MKIEKGVVIVITAGDYDDYSIKAHARALKDFDTKEAMAQFKSSNEYQAPVRWDPEELTTTGSDKRFVDWMIRSELIERLDAGQATEWKIGAYENIDDYE